MSTPAKPNRAQKILRYIVERPKGVTVRELIIAVEPGCKPANMNSSVFCLVYAGKLAHKREGAITRFYATREALVDGRVAANAKCRDQPRRTGPGTPAQIAARLLAAEAKRRATREARAAAKALAKGPHKGPKPRVIPSNAKQFAALQANAGMTSDEFIAKGGDYQRLPLGATANPFLRIGHAANDADRRATTRSKTKAA